MKITRRLFLFLGFMALSITGCSTSGSDSSAVSSSSEEASSSEPSSSEESSSEDSSTSYVPPTHEHIPSDTYYSNSRNHWKKCVECGNHLDEAPHEFGNWYVVKEATRTEEGLRKRECLVCSHSETETIAKKVEKTINLTLDNTSGGVLNSTTLTGFVGDNVTAAVSVNTGYAFDGWYDRRSKLSDNPFYTFALSENTPDLRAKILTNEVNYKVEHYQCTIVDDVYEHVEADDEILSGKTNTKTAAVAKNYDGFIVLPIDQKTIAGDGSTVVKVYYDRNVYRFKLTNDDPDHSEIISPRYTGGFIPFGTLISFSISVPNTEYAFAGWYVNGELKETSPNWIYAMPKENMDVHAVVVKTGHTVYTVRHFLQTYGDNYVEDLDNRQILNGITDTYTTAEALEYEQYVPQSFEQKVIASGGTTVVDIHYTVKKYPLTIEPSSEYSVTVIPDTSPMEYNREVSLTAEVSKPGYEFASFVFYNTSEDYEEVISENPCSYTMKGYPVTVSVMMRPLEVDYGIRIFVQPLGLDDVTDRAHYAEVGMGTEKGYVDNPTDAQNYVDKYCPGDLYQGYYWEDAEHIEPTGTTCSIYYSRKPFKVTALCSPTANAIYTPQINGETYRAGDIITFTGSAQPGYKISYWILRTSSGNYYYHGDTIEVEVTETILGLSIYPDVA